MPVIVRQTDDLDQIVELDRVCFPLDKVISGVTLEDSIWWLATVDGAPVGYAGLYPMPTEGNKAFLSRAGVVLEARGHRLQQKLIRVRTAYAKRLGFDRVYTYVVTSGVPSMRSLVRCGFVPYHYSLEDEGAFLYLEKVLKKVGV